MGSKLGSDCSSLEIGYSFINKKNLISTFAIKKIKYGEQSLSLETNAYRPYIDFNDISNKSRLYKDEMSMSLAIKFKISKKYYAFVNFDSRFNYYFAIAYN